MSTYNLDIIIKGSAGDATNAMRDASRSLNDLMGIRFDETTLRWRDSSNVFGKSIGAAGDAMAATGRVAGAFGEVVTGALRRVGEMAVDAAAEGIGKLVDGVGSAIGIGIEYGDAMNMMGAVSGATGDQMAEVGKAAKALGNDVTLPGASAADAAAAMVELAKAGLSVEESMDAADGVLRMAAAGGLENAQAAEYAANALNSFGLEADKATMIADLFAATANASSVEVSDVADSFNMAASVFSAFQGPAVGAEQAMVDLTTAISILGNAGIKGSDAGTSLKQMMLQLTGPSQTAKDQMKGLYLATLDTNQSFEDGSSTLNNFSDVAMGNASERAAALSLWAQQTGADLSNMGDIAYDASGNMRPLEEIIGLVAKATANMSDEQKNAAITAVFGADASRAVITLMQQGPEAFDAMTEAVTRQGAATELAGAKMQGLGGAVEGFQSTMETLKLVAIEPFMPLMEELLRSVTNAISNMPVDLWANKAAYAVEGLAKALSSPQQALASLGAAFKIIQTGDYTFYESMGGMGDDNPVVNGLVALHNGLKALPELFKKMAEEAAKAIGDLISRIPGVGTAIDAVRTTAEFLSAKLGPDGLAGTFTLIKERVPGLTSVLDTLRPSVDKIRDAAQTLTDKFKSEGLAGALSALPGEFSNVLSSVNTMRTDLISLTLTGVGGLLEKLKDSSGFQTFLSNLGLSKSQIGDVGTVTTNAGSTFKSLGDGVKNVGTWFSTSLTPALTSAASTFGSTLLPRVKDLSETFNKDIMPIIKDVANAIGPILVGAINILSPILAGLIDVGLALFISSLKNIGTTYQLVIKPAFETLGGLLQALTGGWDKAKEGAEAFKNVLSGIANSISSAGSAASALTNAIANGISGGAGSVSNAAGDLVRQAKEKVSSWFNEFKSSGEWLISGLKDGIVGKIGWLTDEVKNGLQAVIRAVKELFHIGSPSKLFEEFGGYLSQGLAIGMTGDLPDVVGAANELGQAAIPNISGGSTAGGSGGGSAAGGVTLTINVSGSVLSERELTQVVLDGLKEYQRVNVVTGIQ